ncbi:zf-HC2 domain-containing protein [Paenibacillus sp. B2(2019)]|uniref:zf-HC2 domain-containing protein n=1 Tax=Paenibacillus sp. B2(2019) TaxID=2607754 RepID=UPI0011F09E7E|nr:zf-HC2 domain-containing protein [Paenibacillus sp. B2(2019)]KAA1184270.1 zf-HC2 domain-containing protein [Paenibacillus sp. B2(2019)]
MKCEIIQDLLPSYIEKLTSLHSNEEIEKHLQTCESCLQSYHEMTATANLNVPIVDKEEVNNLNYFKKVKSKNIKVIVLSILSVIILAAALIGLFVIGFPVSSKDLTIDYQKTKTHLEVHLTLENGKDLVFSGKTKFIRDENNNVIGSETRYTPRGLIHNPFDDVGKKVMLGTEIQTDLDFPNKFILEFKDKTMTFINGVLVE